MENFFTRLDGPTFLVRPPSFVVLDLDNPTSSNPTILRCIVDSFPRSRISWYRYGRKLVDGSTFSLENITKTDQQGVYFYRVETDGFEPIQEEFIIFIKGDVSSLSIKTIRLSSLFSFRKTIGFDSRSETSSSSIE